MESLTYKIDLFEGPLDLLLSLIAKNKINIEDIPIAVICDQYMDYIHTAQSLDMELSAEFLIMASQLMLIKSKMLLPRTGEDEEDPRAELAAAVLEYQRTKLASALLSELYATYHNRMAKEPEEISVDRHYVADHDVSLLSAALQKLLAQPIVTEKDQEEKISPLIKTKAVSVSEKIFSVMRRLRKNGKTRLTAVFSEMHSRSELVATFMAVLELLRAHRLIVETEDDTWDAYGTIDVCCISLTLDPSPHPAAPLPAVSR